MKARILAAPLVTMIILVTLVTGATAAEKQPNEVHILHHGFVQPIEGREFLPGAKPDGARKAGSTISLIKGPGVVMIVDPGMAAAGSWERIFSQLTALGVSPADVTHVFISHHHPDHLTKLGAFPNATVVDFWGTYKDDLWADHPDNWEVAPGITVVRTPGHTDQDASLLVETPQGTYAFTHVWWQPGYQPDKDPLAEAPEALEKSRQLIADRADWIVPGHGKPFRNNRKPN